MYRRMVFRFCGLSLTVFLLGCVTGGCGKIESYKPKSTTESEITKSLMDFQEAYNREDLAGCLSHIHENAQLQISESGTMVSKKDYSNVLEEEWNDYGARFRYSIPDITINEDQAVVKIRSDWTLNNGTSGYRENESNMVRLGDRWLTMKLTYVLYVH